MYGILACDIFSAIKSFLPEKSDVPLITSCYDRVRQIIKAELFPNGIKTLKKLTQREATLIKNFAQTFMSEQNCMSSISKNKSLYTANISKADSKYNTMSFEIDLNCECES